MLVLTNEGIYRTHLRQDIGLDLFTFHNFLSSKKFNENILGKLDLKYPVLLEASSSFYPMLTKHKTRTARWVSIEENPLIYQAERILLTGMRLFFYSFRERKLKKSYFKKELCLLDTSESIKRYTSFIKAGIEKFFNEHDFYIYQKDDKTVAVDIFAEAMILIDVDDESKINEQNYSNYVHVKTKTLYPHIKKFSFISRLPNVKPKDQKYLRKNLVVSKSKIAIEQLVMLATFEIAVGDII